MRVLLAFLFLCSAAYAEPLRGVIAEKQIVNLPEDGEKWYISVVGESGRYQEILGWFEKGDLKKLKSQVHFCPITPKSPLWSRYKKNIKGMPTVRVQAATGMIIYEAAGNNIPMTGSGLYAAIARATNVEELLPWRRRNCQPKPNPGPGPDPSPCPLDPLPTPLDGFNGPPDVGPNYVLWGGLSCVALLIAGSFWGQFEASRTRRQK